MQEENQNNEPKICLECGQPLGAGRSDRKFCNDVCRTAYNNRRRSETSEEVEPISPASTPEERFKSRSTVQNVFDILVSNRIKLDRMMAIYEDVIRLEDFQRYGINLKYFSSKYVDSQKRNFKMCFDCGYYVDGNIVFLINDPNELYFN